MNRKRLIELGMTGMDFSEVGKALGVSGNEAMQLWNQVATQKNRDARYRERNRQRNTGRYDLNSPVRMECPVGRRDQDTMFVGEVFREDDRAKGSRGSPSMPASPQVAWHSECGSSMA